MFCDILYMLIYENKSWLFISYRRYGFCNTIIIRKIAQADLQNEIKSLFKNMIGLKKRGTNLFFTDIDNSK